ncbi:TPA: glycosyltransferase family 4 protein [Escherichia coli]
MKNEIIILTRSLPMHNIGGMEVVCWDLCCALANKGYQITVLTTVLPEGARYDNIHGHLKVVPISNTIAGKYNQAWWVGTAEYLRSNMGRNIHAVISISAAGFSCLKYKNNFKNTKFIMQAHGTSYDEFVSKMKSFSLKKWCASVKNILWFFKDSFAYNKFDYIVAIGDSVETSMKKAPTARIVNANKVIKIENGIDTDLFKYSKALKEGILSKLDIDKDAFIVVSASRLHLEKGVDNNLSAFKAFNNKVENSYYLICGDGPERDNLEKLARDFGIEKNVIFLGALERKELVEVLSCADAFLFLTKRVEGLPLNVLEAMSVGIPAIISKHLTFAESGKLKKVDTNNYSEVSNLLITLFKSKSDIKESYIEERNTLTYAVDKYCQIINDKH